MKLNHLTVTKDVNFSKPGTMDIVIIPEYLNVDTRDMIEEHEKAAGVKIDTLAKREKLEREFWHFVDELPKKMRLNKAKNVVELNPADFFLIPRDKKERFEKFSEMKRILKQNEIEFENRTSLSPEGTSDLLDKAKFGILTKTGINDKRFLGPARWLIEGEAINEAYKNGEEKQLLKRIFELEDKIYENRAKGRYDAAYKLRDKRDQLKEKYNEIIKSRLVRDKLTPRVEREIKLGRSTTDEQVIDSVIKTLDRDKKVDVVIGYLNSPHGKVDSALRKQLNINDKTTNLIGVKIADPFDKHVKDTFVKTDEASVARRAIAGMNDRKLDQILLHIHEESAKDPSMVQRCKDLAKKAGNTLYDVYDYADTALKIYSYFVDVRPNSPVKYLTDFLKGIGKIMTAKNNIEHSINSIKSFSADQGVETKTETPSHYDEEKFDGDVEKDGVIHKKKNGAWGIVSKKTGYFWKQNYDSKEDAEKALKAYHSQHNFDFSFPNSIKLRIVK